MARLIGSFNEGSLLRRTLLHVGTFVLGSLTVVALLSVLLVSVTKAVLPAPPGEASESGAASDKAGAEDDDADEPATGGKPPPSKPRKRVRPKLPVASETGRETD